MAGIVVSQEQGDLDEAHDPNDFPRPIYAWYVMALIFSGACFAFIDRIIVSLVSPALQADLGLSDSQLGLLQGMAFALFYTLFGVPLGLLADRSSRKWLLTIGMSVWSIMTACCGLAKGFGGLFAARLGVGMGEASLNPSVSSLIGDYFPPRSRPRAFAVYVMGQGVGHGMAYIFGGMLLGWLAARGGLELPLLGVLKPWQAMFVLVGLAGMVPTLLFALTVREPKRREFANKDQGKATRVQIFAFMKQNRGTLLCHHFGIAFTVMTAMGFGNWMPTFFQRVHGWPPSHFSVIYGSITLVFGVITPLAVGWLTTWFKDRGSQDASWRLALVGSIGCSSFGAIAPLMPTPELSLIVYVIAGICASPPAVLALIAISEFVPNEMRGVITGIYFMIVGIISTGLGPLAVGLATDFLFADKAAIGRSLSIVSLCTGIPAAALLFFGLRSFRASVARAVWITPSSAPAQEAI
jgi:MFS family permease